MPLDIEKKHKKQAKLMQQLNATNIFWNVSTSPDVLVFSGHFGHCFKLFKADYSRSRLYTYIYNVWYYHWTSNAQFV